MIDQDLIRQLNRLQKQVDNLVKPEVPIGTPIGSSFMWLADTAPAGYLLCYGQAVSRTTYASLFAVIGTTFGAGDGSTTFNLPDMRGRVPLGQDDMGGTPANRVTAASADTIGGSGGAETHTLTTDEMPSHTHGISDEVESSVGTGSNRYRAVASNVRQSSSTGGNQSHNNLQPYLTVNYIIFAGV